MGTSAGRAVSASCSRCANASTVGASNNVRIATSTLRLLRMRLISRVANSE